ncbi:hypothetical protein AXF42_Ash013941 [Apostasia shenzhenica]|uniref:Uncharacterized protein n=1 Tax=Apostasia shenzhenica TaxID=1088818 RepID=A0A2I0ASA7_9ASPA|nr:hypothetical protein AXF42_Ash013941 [Apostasia shenzhenica]
MSSPSLSLKSAVTFALSFSIALTSASTSLQFLPIFPSKLSLKSFSSAYASSSSSSHCSPSVSEKLAADVLSLLGSKRDASRVLVEEAQGGEKIMGERRRRTQIEEDEMVRWPPVAVMELSRLAVDSSGDPGTIQRSLDPTVLPIPDVEGLKKDKCQLTRTPNGYRFSNKGLNCYMEFLFELIEERAPSVGINVSLSRYDLFHGHLFLAGESGRLGILFHAREYPAYEKNFPYNLGYCQSGSNVIYDDSMSLRNILWLAPLPSNATKAWLASGTLVVLDAHPGGIVYKNLVPDYVKFARTIYEDDFGEVVLDVNYINVANASPGERIFVC